MSTPKEYTAEELYLIAHKLLTLEDEQEVENIVKSLTDEQMAEVTRYMDEITQRLI